MKVLKVMSAAAVIVLLGINACIELVGICCMVDDEYREELRQILRD